MKTNHPQKNKPTEWQETRLADIGVFSKGSGISKEQLSESGNNAIRYGELYTKHDFQIKRIYSFIKDDVASQSKEIKYGDILFAGSGETIDEIGKSAAYLIKEKAYAGGDTIIFSPKNSNTLFLSYFLNIGEARKKLRELGQGQSVVHIYKSDIENLKLHLPPLAEQNRIVSVLETWDKAIEKLSKKIEVKKQIKKSLMQNLLTGNKRLKGFSDKWVFLKLGEIGDFRGGNGFPERYQGNSFGDYPFFKVSDMNHLGNEVKMIKSNNWITENIRSDVGATIFPKNTIILAKIGAAIFLERKRILIQDSCIDNNVMGFIVKNLDNNFVFYKFLQISFSRYANITALPSLSGVELSEIEIKVPKSKEEQKAIAEILTTADKEITELEKKLSILKEQKRYLLNNLITGTIRTPETLSIKLTK